MDPRECFSDATADSQGCLLFATDAGIVAIPAPFLDWALIQPLWTGEPISLMARGIVTLAGLQPGAVLMASTFHNAKSKFRSLYRDEAGLQFLAPHQNWILFSLSFVTALILSYVWDAPSAAVRNFLAERGLMRYLMVPAFSPTSPSGSAGAAGRAGAG